MKTPLMLFEKDAVAVARELLGKIIVHGGCSGMIVETEAYTDDSASHAHKRTPRSEAMYSTYGLWYVYFTYGMHYCMNITTNGDHSPGAVLIRALEPVAGIEVMKERRKTDNVLNLMSGPGKLCKALDADKRFNGESVHGVMHIIEGKTFSDGEVVMAPRIGILKARELLWRFYVKDSTFVSKRL